MLYEKVRIKMKNTNQLSVPECKICGPMAIAAARQGKAGYVMCPACAERASTEQDLEQASAPQADRDFLACLDRQLADAVTFLPPAMRASFHAQVGALIRLAQGVTDADRDELNSGGRSHVAEWVAAWRSERDRIRQRTGG